MFINKVNYNHKKQNTIIFVENSLYIAGICKILEFNQININKINFNQTFHLKTNYQIYICEVNNNDMSSKAQKLLKSDNSTRIIIIKNKFDLHEIERLMDVGVKGFLLPDLEEVYLVNLINQVHNGNLFIDHRFTIDIMIAYKTYKQLVNELNPLNSSQLEKLLTSRESEILKLIAKGYTNKQISNTLFISDKTVKNHVSNILIKMDVQDRLNAVLKAYKNNWIKFEV